MDLPLSYFVSYSFSTVLKVLICINVWWLHASWLLRELSVVTVVSGLIAEALLILFFVALWNIPENKAE